MCDIRTLGMTPYRGMISERDLRCTPSYSLDYMNGYEMNVASFYILEIIELFAT